MLHIPISKFFCMKIIFIGALESKFDIVISKYNVKVHNSSFVHQNCNMNRIFTPNSNARFVDHLFKYFPKQLFWDWCLIEFPSIKEAGISIFETGYQYLMEMFNAFHIKTFSGSSYHIYFYNVAANIIKSYWQIIEVLFNL